MKNKYNLALIPNTKKDEVIKFAQQFADIADKYLLGENSLPHLTLYQFEAEETEIDTIWERVCDTWERNPINLSFKNFSCKTFDNNIYWVALLPDNCETLRKMHGIIADAINKPVKNSYDPHMTLINTTNKNCKKEVDQLSSSYVPIIDEFGLSLGKSDDIGQFVKIVHRSKLPNSQKEDLFLDLNRA